jgi:uncharacterized protein (DUF362 family)
MAQVMPEIDWSSRCHVVIKPNLVMIDRPHANTHRDALVTVLELVRSNYQGRLTIAEGSAMHSTENAFEQEDYPALSRFYHCELLDLNGDTSLPVSVYDRLMNPMQLRLAQTIVESDCRISLTLPKTHDTVLATLSIKNMIMGSLVNRRVTEAPDRPLWQDRLGQIIRGHGNGWGSDKVAMHQSYPVINLNLALLAPFVRPHLSIIDGFIAMEGAGPIDGQPLPWHMAAAGTDALAVDTLTAWLMGFELDEIGYLHYAAQTGLGHSDRETINVVGNIAPEKVRRRFVRHPQHQAQRRWPDERAAALLQTPVVLGQTG